MYANKDNSANYGSLLQIKDSCQTERCLEGQSIYHLSVFAIPGGRSRGKQRALQTLIQKNSRSETERAFELPYFSHCPAAIKLIVQGGNTNK